MKILMAAILSIVAVVASIILAYYAYLAMTSSSIRVELLELLPREPSRPYLLIKLSNPTPLSVEVSISGTLYVNGMAVSTVSLSLRAPPHEDSISRVPLILAKPLRVGGKVEIEIRGSETFRSIGIPLLSSIAYTKSVSLAERVPVSPCYIAVEGAGFSPYVVSVGEKVRVWAELYSSDKCVATVELVVLEDNVVGPDIPMTVKVFHLSFPGEHVAEFSWEPPFPSSGSVRGYYVEVRINGTEIYAMPPRYPPRLRVSEIPVSITTSSTGLGIMVVGAWWSHGSKRVWVARVGETVSACVEVEALRSWSGIVTVKVVQDSPMGLVVASKAFHLELSAEGRATLCIPFTPSAPSGGTMRGYYIVVSSRGETLYISPPSYPPRLRVVP